MEDDVVTDEVVAVLDVNVVENSWLAFLNQSLADQCVYSYMIFA